MNVDVGLSTQPAADAPRHRRGFTRWAFWLSLLLAAGCQTTDKSADASPDDRPAAGSAEPTTAATSVEASTLPPRRQWRVDLPAPPGLSADAVAIRKGETLARARADYDDILAGQPVPDYLQGDEQRDDDVEAASGRPPPAALKLYGEARAAYRRGAWFEAASLLDRAHRLDPHSAEILRLLGRTYTRAGNQAKGAMYLREAVQLEPADAESLFLLGEFAYQQNDWAAALVTFDAAAQLADANDDPPGIRYLIRFYLGRTLLRLDRDAAAIRQLLLAIELPDRIGRTTPLARQLVRLDRQRGAIHREVGDAFVRLGRPGAGLDHYGIAGEFPLSDPQTLALRKAYVMLVLRRDVAARQVLFQALRDGDVDLVEPLADYLADHTDQAQRFVADVRELYLAQGRPSRLAIAIAGVMEEDEVAGFLSQHLEARPDDQDVYERMIDRLLDGDPHNAVGAVVRIIRARPGDAGRHVAPLMQSAVDHQRLLAAAKQLDAPLGDTAAAWFVRGMLNRRMQRDEAADADFQRALTLDATFKPAAMARIEMLLARGRTDAALELLDGVDTADDPDMQAFRATLLGRIDRTDEALAIIEHLIARNPSNVDYRMRKAALQLRAEQYRDAERTLWSVLDLDPTLESAYASLIRLYNEHLPDNTQYLRLMRRMQKTIPHSRVARLEMTKFHLARRDYDQALSTLRALVKENPEDVAALDMIVQVLAETKRWDEIVELVEQRTEEAPNLPLPLMSVRQAANDLDKMEQFVPLAAAFLTAGEPTVEKQLMLGAIYAEQSRHDEAIAAMEKALTLKDEIDPEVRIQLARLYDEVGRREDALAEIDAAVAEHPDEAADIYYAKALLHHREDETDAAEATLLKALEADPDHAPSNNDLGYTWADAGRNLQRAKAMISKAVAARPREAAYLDSLGWVHYKLGEFEEAAARLEEARSLPGGGDPVILDHLGDALWQLGREADAVQRWRAARRSAMAQIQGAGDQLPENALAEYRRVRQTTEAKLKAVQADQPPQLAPVPGPADDEADGGG